MKVSVYNIFLISASIFFILSGCNQNNVSVKKDVFSQKRIEKYFLQGQPKTILTLNMDSSFNYISIDKSLPTRNLYFSSKGEWRKTNGEIILTSIGDSMGNDSVVTKRMASTDSISTIFRFYDINKDSVGFMYVTYPDGRDYRLGSDFGDRIFEWIENMNRTQSLEFHFFRYKSWKYFSDGKNYKISVYLTPVCVPDFFKNQKFIQKGDSLITNMDSTRAVFIKTVD